MIRHSTTGLLLSTLLLAATQGEENKLTPAEKSEGWQLIFDGSSTQGWMTITEEPLPQSHVQDGALNPHPCNYMLVYEKPLGDFVLSLDFKLTPNCNSGVFVRTSSLTPRPRRDVGFNGIEIAVQEGDGAGYYDMGAVYDLVKPQKNALNPTGEWNTMQITCDDNLISVVLNGAPVSQMDLNEWTEPHKRQDGTRMKFDVVYKDHPRVGYIGLQDHGSDCWYRNIKLKPLD